MRIELEARQAAAFIAGQLGRIAVPTQRNRSDVGPVQIDPVRITEGAREFPGMRFTFDIAEEFGVTLHVRLDEFAADPARCLAEQFAQLNALRYRAQRARTETLTSVMAVMHV
jgi:hypothetical protein